MPARLLRLALPLACTIGIQVAHADIYTWIDASGTVNISNLAPPDDVRVTKVVPESPPRPAPVRDDASRQAEAQVQMLAERVRQLEYEVELATRQPPPMQYAAIAPPVPQYVVEAPQPAPSECDPTWMQCGNWWGAPFFPATVVVVRTPGFRRSPPFHGPHRVGMQTAMRSQGGFGRR